MNIKLAIRVSVFTILSVVISKAHACCQEPVASFEGLSSVYCGDEVTFTCTSTDADSAISSRSWTASGGTPSTGSGSTFTTKWCSTGPKTVTLEVWDSDSSEGCPPDKSDDCDQEVTVLAVQITSVTSDVDEACVGCNIEFTVITSPEDKYGCIDWSAPGGDPPTGSGGETFITNWDTPGPKTVTADGCSNFMDEQVTIVKVDKVVKAGTTNEGPLYVCLNSTVDLEAKPDPADASFPSGEPHWSIESQPSGANASLTPSSGSATTTLGNLTVAGDYIVKAKCGDSDAGDSITVTVVKVEIEYPYDANNNGKIDDPTNEFSFNAADPAVLQFYCIAFNSPGADADKFRWTIEDIGTIRGEWSPHVVGDEYTGKGLNPTVTFTGMPNNNSDFGPKTITLSYEGLSCTDNETIEVFFEPLAKNNTGPEPDDIPDTIDLNEVVVKERR